jgi:hypothetical protein
MTRMRMLMLMKTASSTFVGPECVSSCAMTRAKVYTRLLDLYRDLWPSPRVYVGTSIRSFPRNDGPTSSSNPPRIMGYLASSTSRCHEQRRHWNVRNSHTNAKLA